MNRLNRILVLVGAALIVLFALAVVVFPGTVLGRLADWFAFAESNVEPFTFVHLMTALGAVVVIFALLFLLLTESGIEYHGGGRAVRLKGGGAELEVDAIARRLAYEVARTEHVLQVHPHVTSRGRSVDVHLTLAVHPEVDLPPVVEEVGGSVRDSLDKAMGVRLHRLVVNVQYPQAEAALTGRLPIAVPERAAAPDGVTES